jgi:hypothetical protein
VDQGQNQQSQLDPRRTDISGRMLKKLFGKKSPVPEKLWSKPEEFDETWKRRISVMASHIKIPGRVADFGCGMMWLEGILPTANSYVPVDYIRRDDRTIVLDLNRDPLPAFNAEVAFLSGVLEYVNDVEAFARSLSSAGFRQIIFSYCTLEHFGDLRKRAELNWVSHKSIFELLHIFLKDFSLTALDDVNRNTIFVFERRIP